jgi:gentisate 1,2-dioxygenase
MGAMGCYLNLAKQQQTDAYVCGIPPGKQTEPQRHLFEEIIYVIAGRGGTSIWQDGAARLSFEWAPGSVFAIPLNSSYQHFNGSRDEPVRLLAGTTCPRMINLFHNEDLFSATPSTFATAFMRAMISCSSTST